MLKDEGEGKGVRGREGVGEGWGKGGGIVEECVQQGVKPQLPLLPARSVAG
jgi:hypothetical protein